LGGLNGGEAALGAGFMRPNSQLKFSNAGFSKGKRQA
jgi:hypothetical protein